MSFIIKDLLSSKWFLELFELLSKIENPEVEIVPMKKGMKHYKNKEWQIAILIRDREKDADECHKD